MGFKWGDLQGDAAKRGRSLYHHCNGRFDDLFCLCAFVEDQFPEHLPLYRGSGDRSPVIIEGRLVNKIFLLFPLVLFCMLLTASTELGTTQWINALLQTNGISPMIILVVVTGIMAVGRFFACGLVHRLNPTGVLLSSARDSYDRTSAAERGQRGSHDIVIRSSFCCWCLLFLANHDRSGFRIHSAKWRTWNVHTRRGRICRYIDGTAHHG